MIAQFPYRLDTNFAKMDRIVHPGIEDFKKRVLSTKIYGLTVGEWSRIICNGDETEITTMLQTQLNIKEEDTGVLIE